MIDIEKLYALIGQQVKDYRRTANLTQTQLAKELGLTRTSVTNIEKGMQRTPLHVIYKLCVYFNQELAQFLPTITEIVPQHQEQRVVRVGNKTEITGNKTASVIEKLTQLELPEKTAAIVAGSTRETGGEPPNE